jgi:hypothetical protein
MHGVCSTACVLAVRVRCVEQRKVMKDIETYMGALHTGLKVWRREEP